MRILKSRPALILQSTLALLGLTMAHNILDHGAVFNQSDTQSAFKNQQAFWATLAVANSSTTDREVYIPSSSGSDENLIFTFMPIWMEYLTNITFRVDGVMQLSDDYENWPLNGKSVYNFWTVSDSKNITITGNGLIEGQGYWWWMREYMVLNKHGRPNMLAMRRVQYCLIEGVEFKNSPRYHMELLDTDTFLIQNLQIRVDILEQKKLAIKHGKFNFRLSLPTFPLNTDGIDPSGSNYIIRNVNITSYDDSIAVKPANGGYQISKCAENILAENLTTWMGVGMTIGSVPPNTQHHCIRNVTFRNINFWFPIKAVYIKSNPGHNGDGIIENILYENIWIFEPIWWNIYIGPQQQKQPDGGGPGCMLYPIIKECETNPSITMRNITLRNVQSRGGYLPGIVRCNATNPCTDINFENVHIDGLFSDFKYGFIVENVYGKVVNTYPDPGFNQTHTITNAEESEMFINTRSFYEKYLKNQTNIDDIIQIYG
eukprot:403336490